MSDAEAVQPGRQGRQDLGAVIQLGDEQGLAPVIFTRERALKGLNWVESLNRAADLEDRDQLDGLGETIWSRVTARVEDRVMLVAGCVVRVFIGRGTVEIVVAGRDREQANEVQERIGSIFREAEEDRALVPVTFWSGNKDGGSCAHRRIECSSWDQIEPGYAPEAAECMRRLVDLSEPDGARLVLWYGPPGTGKTHAIRALAREWQDWCAFHLITDPDEYLESSNYALQVLTNRDLQSKRQRCWNLVVLEDSGELLRNDAREKTGQALSRLLNLTDGLLGQGLNALVLITTNEPIGRLYPAVTRPGRCLAKAEFGKLPTGQANGWLRANGSESQVTTPTSLASLYALANDLVEPSGIQSNLPSIGFAAA